MSTNAPLRDQLYRAESVDQLCELIPDLREVDLDTLVEDHLRNTARQVESGFLTEEESDAQTPRDVLKQSLLLNVALDRV